MAIALLGQGRHEEAELLEHEILTVLKRLYGDEHPDTLASAGNLAICIFDQGRHDEAKAILKDVLDAQKRTKGESHPDTLSAIAMMAKLDTIRQAS
jgi:hypothetical protein